MFRVYNRGRLCSVCRSTNMAQRYKCLQCNAYYLCVLCYEDRMSVGGHNRQHAMQLLLHRRQQEIFIGGEPIPVMLANSFTCPVCGCIGMKRDDLIAHVCAQHKDNNDLIFCPICVAVPNNERMSRVWNICAHLSMCHMRLESIREEDQLQHEKFSSLPNELMKQHNVNSSGLSAYSILRPICLKMMNAFVDQSMAAVDTSLATERNRYLLLNIDASNNDNDDVDKPFLGFADALIDEKHRDATLTAGRTYGIDGVIDTNGHDERSADFDHPAAAANKTQAIDNVANDVDRINSNDNSNESASFLLPRLLQQYSEVDFIEGSTKQ